MKTKILGAVAGLAALALLAALLVALPWLVPIAPPAWPDALGLACGFLLARTSRRLLARVPMRELEARAGLECAHRDGVAAFEPLVVRHHGQGQVVAAHVIGRESGPQLAARDAVCRLVVGDDAVAGGDQRPHEGAHLRGVAAPAVGEQDGRRVVLTPLPRRDRAAFVLDQLAASVAFTPPATPSTVGAPSRTPFASNEVGCGHAAAPAIAVAITPPSRRSPSLKPVTIELYI